MGTFPTAVVLLDTYLRAGVTPQFLSALRSGWAQWRPTIPRLDDELTAMVSYFRMFEPWSPATIAAPILLVRANEPVPIGDGNGTPGSSNEYDWRTRWEQPHTLVEAPGNHLTTMDKHADTTALAIHNWLAALPPASSDAHGSQPRVEDGGRIVRSPQGG